MQLAPDWPTILVVTMAAIVLCFAIAVQDRRTGKVREPQYTGWKGDKDWKRAPLLRQPLAADHPAHGCPAQPYGAGGAGRMD